MKDQASSSVPLRQHLSLALEARSLSDSLVSIPFRGGVIGMHGCLACHMGSWDLNSSTMLVQQVPLTEELPL